MSVVTATLDVMSARDARPREAPVRLISTAELATAGRSPAVIRTLTKRGELVRVAPGLYASGEAAAKVLRLPDGQRALAVAAALAGYGSAAAASHETAARLHGLDLLGRPSARVILTRPRGAGSRSARPPVRMHTSWLPPDQVTMRNGLKVTTVARTVIDVARTSSFRAGVVVADSALRTGQTTKDELRAVLAGCRQWPGVGIAARVVDFADKLSESALESIARVLFRDCGLPSPQLQAWVGGDYQVIARVDFFWKQFNTIAEVDGVLKYADPDRARQQLRRDADLRDAGFEVVHFSWKDITQAPDYVAASIRAAFARGAFGPAASER
jgi:predicted transcriptional regulator of viral defense system